MKELSISQVVRQTKIPSSTIRYYERIGLIHSIGRNGLQRIFNEQVIDQLLLISLGKQAGFCLTDIQIMLQNKLMPIDKDRLEQRACEIDQHIVHLETLRQGLRHVVNCSFENPLNCAKFQKILHHSKPVSAVKKQNKKAKL